MKKSVSFNFIFQKLLDVTSHFVNGYCIEESLNSRKTLHGTEIDRNNSIDDAWKTQCVNKRTDINRKQMSWKSLG